MQRDVLEDISSAMKFISLNDSEKDMQTMFMFSYAQRLRFTLREAEERCMRDNRTFKPLFIRCNPLDDGLGIGYCYDSVSGMDEPDIETKIFSGAHWNSGVYPHIINSLMPEAPIIIPYACGEKPWIRPKFKDEKVYDLAHAKEGKAFSWPGGFGHFDIPLRQAWESLIDGHEVDTDFIASDTMWPNIIEIQSVFPTICFQENYNKETRVVEFVTREKAIEFAKKTLQSRKTRPKKRKACNVQDYAQPIELVVDPWGKNLDGYSDPNTNSNVFFERITSSYPPSEKRVFEETRSLIRRIEEAALKRME